MTDRYDTSNFPEDQSEPGSNGTVLKNLLGITRREELEHVEELRFERLMEAAAARFDSEQLQGAKREAYFAAVRAGMDRNYQPMETIFSGVIERTLSVYER